MEEAKPKKTNYWVKVVKLAPHLKLLPKIFELIQPCIYTFIISYIFKFAISVLNIQKARIVGKIVDVFTLQKLPFDLPWLIGYLIFFYVIIKQASKWHGKINARIINTLNKEVKTDLCKNVLEKDLEFFDKKKPYEAVDAINKGIEAVQNLAVHRFHGTLNPLVKIVGTFALLFAMSKELTLMILLLAPLRVFFLNADYKKRSDKKKMAAKFVEDPEEIPEIPNYSKQHIFLIKAFSTEDREITRFVEKANASVVQPKKVKKDFWNLKFVRNMSGWAFQGVVLAYGGTLIMREKLSYGDLIAVNMHFLTFVGAISSLLINFKMLLKSLASTEKLFEVLDYEPKIKAKDPEAIRRPELKGDIAFNNVSFSYPTKPYSEVLTNISFEIKGTGSVAFVGSHNSGKSTLIYLLQRLYDPTKGQISIDGEDIKRLDVTWLHQNIGYVPQDPILFDGTIEENIFYGSDPHHREDINQVLALANAEFVLNRSQCPAGLQTKLDHNGGQLSVSQKQRIAIARALVKKPKILIVDEPDAKLGPEGNEDLKKALDNLIYIRDRTVIIASRNLENVKNCDRVYMFGEGRMMEERSHKQMNYI